MESFFYLWKYFVETFGLIIAYIAAAVFIFLVLRRFHSRKITIALVAIFIGISIAFYVPNGIPKAFEYPFNIKTYGPADGPALPLRNVLSFFGNLDKFERVKDIARDPLDVPPPITRKEPANVPIEITTKEVIAEIAPGVVANYWTFDGTVPGPFLRVREGDTVTLTLKNDSSSIHMHSIDLHAVTGPGGGAVVTNVAPGESKTFNFKALNPGLYVYHCAHPNVANHMAHGMYGLILVEPEEGLPPVDKELYVMQGEFYTAGARGKTGLQVFDPQKMLDGNPEYIFFNGRTGAISKDKLIIKQGEKVRMYVGNGGVNLISSFHLIGEIFDTVYPEAQMGGSNFQNVQTTIVPAGGAAITEFVADVPGTYVIVDHALSRLDKGAWGTLQIDGEERPEIFYGDASGASHGH